MFVEWTNLIDNNCLNLSTGKHQQGQSNLLQCIHSIISKRTVYLVLLPRRRGEGFLGTLPPLFNFLDKLGKIQGEWGTWAHTSQAFLIILGYEAVVNQTHVGCYLLKCYYFKTKTHTPPAKRKNIQKTYFHQVCIPCSDLFLFPASSIHSIFSGNSFRKHS